MTGITRFAALWCPDFPPFAEAKSDKPRFLWVAKIQKQPEQPGNFWKAFCTDTSLYS